MWGATKEISGTVSRKPRQKNVTTVGVPTEIRTAHLRIQYIVVTTCMLPLESRIQQQSDLYDAQYYQS